MINTFIIEDEEGSRSALRQILEEYIEDINILGEAETVKESVAKLTNLDVDLVFMDIHLPDGESFDILEKLGVGNVEFEIIFITAYTDIKVKAFDYFFLQYLTKPFDIDKIEKAINHFRKNKAKTIADYSKILKDLNNDELKLLPIPNRDKVNFINFDDIVRLEADRNYTNIFVIDDKKYVASKNIKHFAELLDSKHFFRVHKSHLINIKHLKSIDNEGLVFMADGSQVPLAKRARKEFFDFFK